MPNVFAITGNSTEALGLEGPGYASASSLVTLPIEGRKCAYSPDGAYLAIASTNDPGLLVYNTTTWATVTLPDLRPAGSYYGDGLAFSQDGAYLAITSPYSPYVQVLDTSTWSLVVGTPTLAGEGGAVAFSPDGAWLAVTHGGAPFFAIYNTSDWSQVSGTPAPGSGTNDCHFSPDGAHLALTTNGGPKVYDTSDWSEVTTSISITVQSRGARFSNDGAWLAITYSDSPYLAIVDTSTWSKLAGTPTLNGMSLGMAFSSDDGVLVATSASPFGVHVIDTSDWSSSLVTSGFSAGPIGVSFSYVPTLPVLVSQLDFSASFDGAVARVGNLDTSLGFAAAFTSQETVTGSLAASLGFQFSASGAVQAQEVGALSLPIQVAIGEPFGLPIELTVEPATLTGSASLPVALEVVAPERFTLPIDVSVFDAAGLAGNGGLVSGGVFSVYVEVGGEDYTSRLVGAIDVDAEEDSARVASLTLMARAGEFEPDLWISLPVLIDVVLSGVGYRLFTGIVDVPTLSIKDETITLACTDDRQGRFDNQARETIEEIFEGSGALWSPAVFGEYEDSARFAEDLQGTIAASVDLDRNGQLVISPWYSAAVDYDFADDEVFPASVEVEWGSRRDIITRVDIELEYTYQHFRERRHRYVWDYPRTFEDYLQQNTSLPSSDMVTQAASVAGWQVMGEIGFDRLPESGDYSVPGGSVSWVISDEVRQTVAIGADFTLQKRWVQDVRETYRVAVRSLDAIDRYGPIAVELGAKLDTSVDETGFTEFERDPDAAGTAIGSDTGWTSRDPAVLSAAVETAVASAKVQLLDSCRQNSVSFSTLIQPELELYHTVRLQSATVTAEGKCRRVRHRIDLAGSSATTEVEFAVFRGTPAVGAAVALTPMDYAEAPVVTTTVLGTRIQDTTGTVTAPDDGFQGYVGNYVFPQVPTSIPNPFDERFAILSPEIAPEARDPVELTQELTVDADQYNQTLIVSL